MSLDSCIASMGKALDQNAADEIRALVAGGMPLEAAPGRRPHRQPCVALVGALVVGPGGAIKDISYAAVGDEAIKQSTSVCAEETLNAPLAGNIFKVLVKPGDKVAANDVVIIMEAMKMETEIRAVTEGEITVIHTKEGDSVAVGEALLSLV